MNKTISQINIKNIDAGEWQRLLSRLPISPSTIIRAMIYHANNMTIEEYTQMLRDYTSHEEDKRVKQS